MAVLSGNSSKMAIHKIGYIPARNCRCSPVAIPAFGTADIASRCHALDRERHGVQCSRVGVVDALSAKVFSIPLKLMARYYISCF